MAPPGRRRSPLSGLSLLFSLFLIFSSTASAASAVLGIDLGTEYLKAVLVKPGIPLEIVLSKDSKRKEFAAVAFKPSSHKLAGAFPERLYGGDALALAARFPSDVYPHLKPLLGVRASGSRVVGEFVNKHPGLKMVEVEKRGTVGFKSDAFGKEEKPWSVEELLAMELRNVRENAEMLAGESTKITDAVITIPAFYTADERRAILLAAELAGLKVLSLISDGLAVGLNYATTRTFPDVTQGGNPEYHLVFDMGAGSTTATVLKFNSRTVKDVGRFNKTVQEVSVIGTGWDRTLGGDALNALIVDDMVEKFVASPAAKKGSVEGEKVRSHGRTIAKLLKDAKRLRHIISANSETSTTFESLYEDIDFRYKISRADFEKMAEGFAARVETPIRAALEAAGLTIADLKSIILHGGAMRTPFVQKKLEGVMGDAAKLRSNVNSDEAAVFGAAFKGASLSPSFRVKEIRDTDISGYTVGIAYLSNLKDLRQKLFVPTSALGTVKTMPFKMMGDFEFGIYQMLPSHDDPTNLIETPVLGIRTGNLTRVITKQIDKDGCHRDDIIVHFEIRLDPTTGLPEVVKPRVGCEVDEAEKKGGVMDDVKDFFGLGKKDKGEQEPLKDVESSTSSLTAESTPSSSSSESGKASETSSQAASSESAQLKKRIVSSAMTTHLTQFGIEKVPRPELKRIKERLQLFEASDAARRSREERLNALEAFTYKARELLTDESFVEVSTTEQRERIETAVNSASDWLYGEGTDATEETLKSRLKELESLVNPVIKRREESKRRPKAVKILKEAIDQSKMLANVIKEQVEKAAEAKSSAEAEAIKSSSEAGASSSSTPASSSSEQTPSSADPLDDLEEKETTTISTTSTQETPKPSPLFESPYTADDISELTKLFDAVSDWLATKEAEQDKLALHQDPAFLVAEVEAKARQLNEGVMGLLQKKLKTPPRSKTAKPKPKSKKAKTKSKKTKEEASTKSVEDNGKKTDQPEPVKIKLGKDGKIPNQEEILEKVRKAKGEQEKGHDEL